MITIMVFWRILIVVSVTVLLCHAQEEKKDASFVDRLHRSLSEDVQRTGDWLDERFYALLGEDIPQKRDKKKLGVEEVRQQEDTFFQTQKYLNETSQTYIRLRTLMRVREGLKSAFDFNVNAHLPLSRTQRRLRIFLEGSDERRETPFSKVTSFEGSSPQTKFGLNYFAPKAWGATSKYSLAVSGLHPYLKARYNKVFLWQGWAIEPVQSFRYSIKDDFSEETECYFDRKIEEDELVRFELYRSTKAHEKGMDYGGALSLAWLKSKKSGVRLVQSFAGNSDYRYIDERGESRKYTAPSLYATSLVFRRTLWRSWLSFEMAPTVEFAKADAFHPAYSIRFVLELLVGYYR